MVPGFERSGLAFLVSRCKEVEITGAQPYQTGAATSLIQIKYKGNFLAGLSCSSSRLDTFGDLSQGSLSVLMLYDSEDK